jgi:chromosome segregation ATPase
LKQRDNSLSQRVQEAQAESESWKWKYEQVARMCSSLTYENDECKAAYQEQLNQTEQLQLRLREIEQTLQTKETDLSFLQNAVCSAPLHRAAAALHLKGYQRHADPRPRFLLSPIPPCD